MGKDGWDQFGKYKILGKRNFSFGNFYFPSYFILTDLITFRLSSFRIHSDDGGGAPVQLTTLSSMTRDFMVNKYVLESTTHYSHKHLV